MNRLSDRELDKAARNNGYKDARDLKQDFRLDKRSDIFLTGVVICMLAIEQEKAFHLQVLHINMDGAE